MEQHLCSHFCRLIFTLSLQTLLFLVAQRHGGLWSVHSSSPLPLLPPHTFLLLSHGFSTGCSPSQKKKRLLQHVSSMDCSSFRNIYLLPHGSCKGYSGYLLLHRPSTGHREYPLCHGSTLPFASPFFFSPLAFSPSYISLDIFPQKCHVRGR